MTDILYMITLVPGMLQGNLEEFQQCGAKLNCLFKKQKEKEKKKKKEKKQAKNKRREGHLKLKLITNIG